MLPTEKLLSMTEAADRLGYSRSGLQKIVDASRRGASSPFIKFFQRRKGARIKFLSAWIDDFIEENAHGRRHQPAPPYQTKARAKTINSPPNALNTWPS
jgi:hypothetical protein